MNEDIKEEFKSTRRSIGGGGGFYGTVENVSETSDREYYAFLNVTPESSEDEIKAAYKRLALLWHPDRHKEEESRERATAQFAKLTQIHDVLSDPKKRKLYDLYGEKGLSSGMEVGAHLRTHDQVRDEYIRHMAKKKQKHLEAKLGLAGVLQTTVDLRDYLSASDYVSNRGGSGGGSGAAGQQDKRSLLTSAMLSQRFRTSLSRKDTMELQGQVISKKGNGASLLTLSGKRQFSVRSWAKMMLQAGLGVEQVPFSFAAFRQLSKETMSKVSLRFAGAVLELKCALQHRMSDDSLGRIQYILGGDRGGVKVKMTKSGERTVVNASVWVGMRQYSIAATWNRHLSKRTLISVPLNL
jgi:DnaJ family protein C protein 11